MRAAYEGRRGWGRHSRVARARRRAAPLGTFPAPAPRQASARQAPPRLQIVTASLQATILSPTPTPAAAAPSGAAPRYSQDPAAAQSKAGGVSSIALNGTFYDSVPSSRRGVTSLVWAKPKMGFKANSGKHFE